MERCKTCKWWRAGQCERPFVSTPFPEGQQFDVGAAAADDSGLDVRVFTGPEFGCVLHTPKGAR